MNKTIEIENRRENQIGGGMSEKKPSVHILGFIAAGLALDIAIVLYAIISNVL